MNPLTRTDTPISYSNTDSETVMPGSLSNSSSSTFSVTSQAALHSAGEVQKLIHEMLRGHPSQRDCFQLREENPVKMLGLLRESESSKMENIEALALQVSNLRCSGSFVIHYQGAYLGCRKGDTVFNLCFRALNLNGDSIMQSLFTDVISKLSSYMLKTIEQNKKNASLFKACLEDTSTQFKEFSERSSQVNDEKKLFLDHALSQRVISKAEESPPPKKKARHDFSNRDALCASQQFSEQFVKPRSYYTHTDQTSIPWQESVQEKFLPSKSHEQSFYGEMTTQQSPNNAKRKYTPDHQAKLIVPGIFSRINGSGESFLFSEHLAQRVRDQIFVDGSFILAYLKKIENLTESDLSLETIKDIGRLRCSDSGTISYNGSKINIKYGDTLLSVIFREFRAFEDMKVWFKLFTKLNKIHTEMSAKATIDPNNIFNQCCLDTARMRKLPDV